MNSSDVDIKKLKAAFVRIFDSLVDAVGKEDAMQIIQQRLSKKITHELDIVKSLCERLAVVGATVMIEQDNTHYLVSNVTVERDSFEVVDIEFMSVTGQHHVYLSLPDIQTLVVSEGCFWFTNETEGRVLFTLNDSNEPKRDLTLSNATSPATYH